MTEVDQATGHTYLSTACWHERHDYCNSMVGYQGEKRPAQCKFCSARCICECHNGIKPLRDTGSAHP